MSDTLYKIKSVILGHAVADAIGVPVEFASRAELDEASVTDMEGFGTYPYDAGAWSDDTSMGLCALDSLAKGEVDFDEIMQNFYKWANDGEYTSVDECFDIGRTCLKAIMNYKVRHTPAIESGEKGEHSNGNGSLMRILPFVLFNQYCNHGGDKFELIHNASALTHAHERSKIGCGIYAIIMQFLLEKPSVHSVYMGLKEAAETYKDSPEIHHYKRIFNPNFWDTPRDEIKSSGYVVDTLEAALWCLLTTDSYKECVLKAVNLGEDTDTVAAVAGGMAGALYGYDAISKEWLNKLMKRDYIEELCERVYMEWSEKTIEVILW